MESVGVADGKWMQRNTHSFMRNAMESGEYYWQRLHELAYKRFSFLNENSIEFQRKGS